MKVLHRKFKFFVEVLDELDFFIDKKLIFDEKKVSVGPPTAFVISLTFFPFDVDISLFQDKVF
jgi:hypothetical protein